ncbi:MAG: carboxypeptidase regulatory-like domain-containing protein [Legionella sp.]|uniref:carboxypeptidase regulatory-like domain-containing protein n=1 Tax=Legionella sp. TaxID=459 RepID=UPI0039E25081
MKNKTALVSGFARSFVSGMPIADATITIIENEQLKFHTNSAGKFGPFEWPVGQPITLVLEKQGSFWSGYKTTQTATLIVPPEGIDSEKYLKNISFQVPSNMAYKFLAVATGLTEDPLACQIAATITPPNTTLDDIPQGIEGVTVKLSPCTNSIPYYFGIFPIVHKTNPFIRTLTSTSLDGGVLFPNVPPGDYILYAEKNGMIFSEVTIKARQGILVNASPPKGPTLQHERQIKEKDNTNYYNFFKPALEASTGSTVGHIVEGCMSYT